MCKTDAHLLSKGRRTLVTSAIAARIALAALSAGAGLATSAAAQSASPAARQAFPEPAKADQRFRLHHVTLFVRDQEALSAWYVRHFGFEIVDRAVLAREDGVRFDSVRVGIPGLWINISRLPNLASRDPALTYNGWRQVSLAVRDVQALLQQLKANGVDVIGQGALTFDVQGSRFGANRYRAGFVRDPEGNVIELYEDM